jgi:hypothetical protein
MFVAFSCKQRCTCPSCHQKRALLTALHVAEEVCSPVAHRQVVLTIPKRLRPHARFDRKLLGKLCSCAWTCIQAEVRRLLGREDVAPGMVGAIQTHGELLHWHPHIHALVTCGAFTPEGDFLEVPQLDMARLEAAWREGVFVLYLAEDKIGPEVVENMRTWAHSGFSVDQSVFLPAGDRAGTERLVRYMTRCPFSLSRLIKVTATGQVIYKAEKDACRAFPDPQRDELARGPKRNFQILGPLEFLAEFTQHVPPTGSHLIRYYGWYSNKARGMRRKAGDCPDFRGDPAQQGGEKGTVPLGRVKAAPAPTGNLPSPSGRGAGGEGITRRASQTWAMLIKRVYEVDPLACPKCGATMKVISFIEPPQTDVIERILRHCGLWCPSAPRAPPAGERAVHGPDGDSDEPRELTYVPDPDWDSQAASSDEPWEVTFHVDGDTFDPAF